MSNCYKNFPIIVNYSSGPADSIFSNSASLSENLDIQNAESLGAKGANTVFTKTLTQGELSAESYLYESDLSIFNNLKGENDQGITLQFGPYACPAPCVLSSLSVNINIGAPITVNRSFSYFGGVTSAAVPAPAVPSLEPVIPENINLNGFETLGNLSNIQSISWQFSQSYETYYLLGESVPKIVFSAGQITMDVQGEGIANALTVNNCAVPASAYSIQAVDCNGVSLGALSINGYAQTRTSSASSDSDEQNSVSIIQYL